MATQASEQSAAIAQLGLTGPFAKLTVAQRQEVNRLALALAQSANAQAKRDAVVAKGAASLAAAQAKGVAQQAIKGAQLQANANLVSLRGQNNSNRVANLITNFQTQLYQMVAAAGHNVLTPAFQQKFNNSQTHFAATIRSYGGNWVNIPLESIAPELQNSNLAMAGVGLTNASTAAVLQADTTALNTAIAQASAATAATAAAALNPATATTIGSGSLANVGDTTGTTLPISGVNNVPTPIGSAGATAGNSVGGGGGGGGEVGTGGSTGGATTSSSDPFSFLAPLDPFFGSLGFTSNTQIAVALAAAGFGLYFLLKHRKKG